ncbi:nuclear transport factor 2 family protein [Zunongwangia sp. H14]|uniref:nuclear transport factor 2 family protein n=1 Tax=Zunongwangia sp. H14 TaxID=3240792 RepID=UPI0035662489
MKSLPYNLFLLMLSPMLAFTQVTSSYSITNNAWQGKLAEELGYNPEGDGDNLNPVFTQDKTLNTSGKLRETNLKVIQNLYLAFSRGDISAITACMDPGIEWNEAENFPYADRNPYIGPQAIVDGVFARIGEEWEYWNVTNINYYEMYNNKILVTGRYSIKNRKNGVKSSIQMAHLWELENGKIKKFQQFADTKAIAEVMK